MNKNGRDWGRNSEAGGAGAGRTGFRDQGRGLDKDLTRRNSGRIGFLAAMFPERRSGSKH